jgi:hypothetical protein
MKINLSRFFSCPDFLVLSVQNGYFRQVPFLFNGLRRSDPVRVGSNSSLALFFSLMVSITTNFPVEQFCAALCREFESKRLLFGDLNKLHIVVLQIMLRLI